MKKLLVVTLVMMMVLGLVGGVGASSTAPYWNIEGEWTGEASFDEGRTVYRYFTIESQCEDGYFSGVMGALDSDGTYGASMGGISGKVSGNEVDITFFLDNSSYESYRAGTIASDGNSMAGTWDDTNNDTGTWFMEGEAIHLFSAAPAVAVELLKDADISHRYGSGRDGGNFIADVAHHMGDTTDFNGVSKYDECAYRYQIAMFLNQSIAEEGVGGEVTVPDLLYELNITSVNGNTGFTHYFNITYNVNTGNWDGYGISDHAGNQSLSDFDHDVDENGNIDYIQFRSDYDDTSYFWFPAFNLLSDNTLEFVDIAGDNVNDATGTWALTYLCE